MAEATGGAAEKRFVFYNVSYVEETWEEKKGETVVYVNVENVGEDFKRRVSLSRKFEAIVRTLETCGGELQGRAEKVGKAVKAFLKGVREQAKAHLERFEYAPVLKGVERMPQMANLTNGKNVNTILRDFL